MIADNGVVAWFQGRSEYGPRALGHRSLLAHPGRADNVERLNDIKGREQFRPVAPMVLAERAAEIFGRGPLPSPYMLFVHDVAPAWRDRLQAVTHVDHTARVQTVDPDTDPLTGPAAGPVRRTHRHPGRSQHQPEHRRAADGGQSARRPRAVRVGPGRRAGHRPVPAPPALSFIDVLVTSYAVVIPTIGRAELADLIRGADGEPATVRIVVADDRRAAAAPLPLPPTNAPLTVVRSGGRGPAAARNAGWRAPGGRRLGRLRRRRRRAGAGLERATGRPT